MNYRPFWFFHLRCIDADVRIFQLYSLIWVHLPLNPKAFSVVARLEGQLLAVLLCTDHRAH
jgi:hypothetical protein